MVETELIYCGDNLTQLAGFPSESVDLVYLDPPQGRGADQYLIAGNVGDRIRLQTEWKADRGYSKILEDRIRELRRVMKSNAYIYYHCNGWENVGVRLMLDRVFGHQNLISQIIWHHGNQNRASRSMSEDYDAILLYGKSGDVTLNRTDSVANVEQKGLYVHTEEGTGRRFKLDTLTTTLQERPNLTYEFLGVKRTWKWPAEKMHAAYNEGRIIQHRPGTVPVLKRYLDEATPRPLSSVWADIRRATRALYPTQKPVALLERIISISSNPGDLVLDPFCGTGSTLVAAQKLGRRWIGIDTSSTACRVAAGVIAKETGLLEGKDYRVVEPPRTSDELRRCDPVEFENWVLNALPQVLGGSVLMANEEGDALGGADAHLLTVQPANTTSAGQVWAVEAKQTSKTHVADVRRFASTLKHLGVSRGVFVAFAFSASFFAEAERLRQEENLQIRAMSVQEMVEALSAERARDRGAG